MAMTHPSPEIDWAQWMKRWDIQQTGYLPVREARFDAMLDVLEVLLPETFVALDLACGPGSISRRILTRFPNAHCIAVDLDPVLLTMGQHVLGDMGGRLRWIDANLATPDWVEEMGVDQIDAALSTTALHWLPTAALTALYGQLGQLIRPGGVVLNGDHIKFDPPLASFQRVADAVKQRQQDEAFEQRGVENWSVWWEALKAESALEELFAERERRFNWRDMEAERPTFNIHAAALRQAGFQEVGVIWQRMDNRVLMAVR
jgi:trans-aconitate methyltransferase